MLKPPILKPPMLNLPDNITIPSEQLNFSAIRAQGSGGQNVNKVSTAIHLRFDIQQSNLPESCKTRLLALNDSRINKQGVIVIKSQQYRSQEKNKQAALQRLGELLGRALHKPKTRRATQPGKNAKKRRMDTKSQRGKTKNLRKKPTKQAYE